MSFVWCMLSVLNNQSRLLVNTRPCKRINKTMQVWMTLRVLLTKLGAFCFFCDFHIVRLSSASRILFYTVWHITLLHCFFFNDHFTNSRCLVQCFISSNKTSLSFLENFIMMVLVIIAVWEDTKKQQWIIVKKATENFCVPLPLPVPLLCQTTKLELQALVSERKCFKKASSSKTHTHSFPVVDLSGDSFSLKL